MYSFLMYLELNGEFEHVATHKAICVHVFLYHSKNLSGMQH